MKVFFALALCLSAVAAGNYYKFIFILVSSVNNWELWIVCANYVCVSFRNVPEK